jgi:hypothetical protein
MARPKRKVRRCSRAGLSFCLFGSGAEYARVQVKNHILTFRLKVGCAFKQRVLLAKFPILAMRHLLPGDILLRTFLRKPGVPAENRFGFLQTLAN